MNNLKIQDSDPITPDQGLKLNARVAKNRCVYDNPYKKCEFYVIYGVGVDKLTEIMDNGPEAGVLRKSGSWFYYEKEDGELITADRAIVRNKDGDEVLEKDVPLKFQGKTSFRQFLTDNQWFVDQLKAEIRGKAARGELIPTYQDESEMKEIEQLNAIEKQIAAEEAKKGKKKPAKPKEEQDKRAKELERSSDKEKKPAPSKKKKEETDKDIA